MHTDILKMRSIATNIACSVVCVWHGCAVQKRLNWLKWIWYYSQRML